ncbi:ferrous iron transport protein B [Anaeroselena agilis]|uniref:Ferrous iron transport protein B n=1 Tax=Anaeroselena agilis TaxID=3063788 RepID=A0ABU3P1C1_9FIRM|nr:ferrous iron transport protein B [Selenomonadales bacterium 4137-cl]
MTKKTLSVDLVGNPNVGKSSLFNALTGAAQLIGNWCGKTTEACTTKVAYGGREISFTDLPGVYGFGHASREETLVDKHLRADPPDVVLVIVDALNLERNLYLALEALERYGKVVVLLNKIDAAGEHGMVIDHARLAALLGIPVIPAVATGQLDAAALYHALFAVADRDPAAPYAISYPPAVEAAIAAVHAPSDNNGLARWRAVEAVEEADEDLQVEIINARYAAAAALAAQCLVHHPTETLTDKIDRWALHRIWGVPIMIVVFAVLFYLTFTVSRPLSDLLGLLFETLAEYSRAALPAWGVPDLAVSLLVDGLLSGIGATLGFLPQIAIFFLVYHIIQDTGYIVRVAFLMDRVMTAIGLNGKIFIPLVAGYSCNVSGILASRILTSRYDRLVAVLASSYAPCSARLGVMVFVVSAFFPSGHATLVMLALLAISVAMMATVAFVARFFVTDDESSPFLSEVPVYHLPDLKHLLLDTGARTLHFLKRIRNVIILSSILVWYLSTFPAGPFENTYLARIGLTLEPFGALFGLDWQLLVALIAGIPAKESALTTLGVIYQASGDGGLATALTSHISPLAAFTFLVVYMTYIPCLATVITIYQEMRNWSVAVASVYGSILLSVLLGLLSYNIGKLFF